MAKAVKGSKLSEETKQKIREKALAQKKDPDYIAKFNAGYHSKMKQLYADPEWMVNKSQIHKQIAEKKKLEDPEYYAEWGRKSAGKNWQNPEYREKMVDSAKSLWDSEDKRQQQQSAIAAARSTDESKAKTSAATKTLWQNPEHAKKVSNSLSEYYADPANKIFNASEENENKIKSIIEDLKAGLGSVAFLCKKYNMGSHSMVIQRARMQGLNHLIGTGSIGLEIQIRSILDKYNITYVCCTRSVIKPLELDIYVPKNSLGIELNGLYWHSSAHDFERGRHAKKAKVATQNNIKLLAFYEDEVLSKIELIESMILSKCGLSPYKVGARKLSLKEVSLQNAKVFFEENHLDGSVQCSLALGLYDNKNNLLACMSFRQYAGSKYKYMEIARFAVSKFCSIPGAASRLIRHSGFKELVSYSNNRCSDGNLYRSMGFIEDTASTQPSYWYTDLNNRYFRTMCRKIDTGIEETEEQQAARGLLGQKILGKSVPMFRIEDYGHRRWILTK